MPKSVGETRGRTLAVLAPPGEDVGQSKSTSALPASNAPPPANTAAATFRFVCSDSSAEFLCWHVGDGVAHELVPGGSFVDSDDAVSASPPAATSSPMPTPTAANAPRPSASVTL